MTPWYDSGQQKLPALCVFWCTSTAACLFLNSCTAAHTREQLLPSHLQPSMYLWQFNESTDNQEYRHANIQLQTQPPSLSARTEVVSLHNTPYFPQHVNKPLWKNKAFKGTFWGPSHMRIWTGDFELEITSSLPQAIMLLPFYKTNSTCNLNPPTELLYSLSTACAPFHGGEMPNHPAVESHVIY